MNDLYEMEGETHRGLARALAEYRRERDERRRERLWQVVILCLALGGVLAVAVVGRWLGGR